MLVPKTIMPIQMNVVDNQLNEAADPSCYISVSVCVQPKAQCNVFFLWLKRIHSSWFWFDLLRFEDILALWYCEYQKLAFEKQHVIPKTITWWLTTTHDNPCTDNCFLVKPNTSEPHYGGEPLILSTCLDRYC